MRVKQTPSSSSNSAAAATNTTESQTDNKDPPKIIVDSNEEWEAIRADASTEVEDYTQVSPVANLKDLAHTAYKFAV